MLWRCFSEPLSSERSMISVRDEKRKKIVTTTYWLDYNTVRILRVQVRASSQTKGLERGWEQRARKTLTPHFTDFFTDFEKKTRLFCSPHIDKKLNSRSCAKKKYTCQGRCVPRKKFYPRKRGITTQVDFRTGQSTRKGRRLPWVKEGHDWSIACK